MTGGAGYIGSHTIEALLKQDHSIVVLDNLSTGFQAAVPTQVQFIQGDVRDIDLVTSLLRDEKIEAILHFAAKLIVPESVQHPLDYYDNNVFGTLQLLKACEKTQVKYFILSSTAAVYGNGTGQALKEADLCLPINPYGTTKMICELQLRDFAQSLKAMGRDFRWVALRYFNVAGASSSGRNGQRSKIATHLIKIASQVATGLRPAMEIFGSDYKTPDGTCIRDYIHVEDLASAHVCALEALKNHHPGGVFNCGYGRGSSVLEVLQALREVSGQPVSAKFADRRPGDPALLVADSERIRRELGWSPVHDDLRRICKSAYEWEKTLAQLGPLA